MVSTHISSRGLTWQLGDKDIILTNTNNSNIENEVFIVQIPEQMNISTLKTNQTTLLYNLIYYLKYIFTY